MTVERGDNILEISSLSIGYDNTAVVSGIDLHFKRGQLVCILGPNGAGKTTLLRVLSRHLKPISGKIVLKGRELSSYTQLELARVMAVVLTERVAPPLFSVYQFVALGRYPYTDFLGRLKPDDDKAVQDALALVGADMLSQRDFQGLSDGERQKVLLARALCQGPEVLILDEPTAHLDLKHRLEVMGILRNLTRERGILVIASLHDVDVAAKVADVVVMVKDGKVTEWGPPEEVLKAKKVESLYGLENAVFSSKLGTLELPAKGQGPQVFVVGGNGEGAGVMRLLAKKGFKLSTGVLFKNDLDYFVARALGANILAQEPSGSISRDMLLRAEKLLSNCLFLVDALPVGIEAFKGNQRLVERARELGIEVVSKDMNLLNLEHLIKDASRVTFKPRLCTAKEARNDFFD